MGGVYSFAIPIREGQNESEKVEIRVPGSPLSEFWRVNCLGLLDKAVGGKGKEPTGIARESRKSLHGCRQGKILWVMDYREENIFIGPVSGILDGNRQELIAPKLIEATFEWTPHSLQEIIPGEFGWMLGSNVPVIIAA